MKGTLRKQHDALQQLQVVILHLAESQTHCAKAQPTLGNRMYKLQGKLTRVARTWHRGLESLYTHAAKGHTPYFDEKEKQKLHRMIRPMENTMRLLSLIQDHNPQFDKPVVLSMLNDARVGFKYFLTEPQTISESMQVNMEHAQQLFEA